MIEAATSIRAQFDNEIQYIAKIHDHIGAHGFDEAARLSQMTHSSVRRLEWKNCVETTLLAVWFLKQGTSSGHCKADVLALNLVRGTGMRKHSPNSSKLR